jgi:hypothetical protein
METSAGDWATGAFVRLADGREPEDATDREDASAGKVDNLWIARQRRAYPFRNRQF